MKVFVTGATGFVGQEVTSQLIAAGHEVRALVRSSSNRSLETHVETVIGDTTRPETLKGLLEGCDAAIHLVGIIREFPAKGITFERLHTEATANVLSAAKEQGVKRYIQMSANGTGEQSTTGYHRTKWAAEQQVQTSGLDWTIFRPSLIFGPKDDFVNMLARMIKLSPLVPVFGDGLYPLQPVHVVDVARGFVAALEQPDSIGQTLCCCGPDAFSYDELLDRIGTALGLSRVRKIHQPLPLVRPLVRAFQPCTLFPITLDQLTMLVEGNTCENDAWVDLFQINRTSFDNGIRAYLTRKNPSD